MTEPLLTPFNQAYNVPMRNTLYAFLFAASLFAQTPDLTSSGSLTAVGNGTPIWTGAGAPGGIVGWRLNFHVDGASITAAQVAIQGANVANAAACTSSASFATITTANADLVESVNPAVSGAQGNVAVKTYYPCIRARVTAITGSGGTVSWILNGYKGTFVFPQTVTVIPSGTQNVNLIQVDGTAANNGGLAGGLGVGGLAAAGATTGLGNPNQEGGIGPDGALRPLASDTLGSQYQFLACNLSAEVALSGTAYTTIITGSGSDVIRICKAFVTSSSGGNPTVSTFNFAFGTCASSPTEIFQAAGVTGLDMDFGGSIRGTAGQSFCVKESASQSDKVTVTYAKTVF